MNGDSRIAFETWLDQDVQKRTGRKPDLTRMDFGKGQYVNISDGKRGRPGSNGMGVDSSEKAVF